MSGVAYKTGENGGHLLIVGQAAIISSVDIIATSFSDCVVTRHAGRL